MAKTHTEVISLRLSPQFVAAVTNYAMQYGHTNTDGSPNLSAASRTLMAIGLDRGDGHAIAQAATENARSELMQKVADKMKQTFNSLSEYVGGLG